MCRTVILFQILLVSILIAKCNAEFGNANAANNEVGTASITVTKLDISDKTLTLSYRIRNATNQDIWILAGFGFPKNDATFEVAVDADDRTLLMQRRLDFPMVYTSIHGLHGRYVLLRAGHTRTESVTLAVPVNQASPFGDVGRKQVVEQATRLAMNIAYYDGDLPKTIWDVIQKPDTMGNISRISHNKLMTNYFTGPLEFNWVNESLKERDEEILIPHTDQYLQYEKNLHAVVEDLAIPYYDKFDIDAWFDLESPDIPQCTRIEIEFRPSMLEYYFPRAGQQSLLSDSERQTLQSLHSVIVNNQQTTDAFVSDINEMVISSGVVRQTSLAHVVCYRENEALASFEVFDDNCIVTEACNRYVCSKGSWSLRKFTPEIEPYELRVQCAANLRNLWYRLRLNYEARKASPLSPAGSSDKTKISYPVATDWCDALVRACRTVKRPHQNITKMSNQEILEPHICPGAGEGKRLFAKGHYSMNPNCKYDSAPDMVLLFETKVGWNQHGGPELFTFDNHDPKGGCVLLNDATVKFIRTKEELQQLRWK